MTLWEWGLGTVTRWPLCRFSTKEFYTCGFKETSCIIMLHCWTYQTTETAWDTQKRVCGSGLLAEATHRWDRTVVCGRERLSLQCSLNFIWRYMISCVVHLSQYALLLCRQLRALPHTTHTHTHTLSIIFSGLWVLSRRYINFEGYFFLSAMWERWRSISSK